MLNMTWLLAQNDNGGAAGAMMILVVQLAVAVLVIAGMWQAFAKAGKPGWAAIIPIYNVIVILEIAGKPIWWIILLLIPCVNIIIILLVMLDVAKAYGKGAGFGIGLFLLGFIFWPILGFGDAKYVGPQAS